MTDDEWFELEPRGCPLLPGACAAVDRIEELEAEVARLRTAEADMRERAAYLCESKHLRVTSIHIRTLPLSTDTPKKETYA